MPTPTHGGSEPNHAALVEHARAWLAEDPDPDTRAELEALLAADDTDGLAARFAAPLEFGTAGIRGRLGAGPARMNRLVVREVTAGLALRLAEDAPPEEQRVVVGRDARHKSPDLAEETAAVLVSAGFDVTVLDGAVPTPLLAYAVRYLGAAAGVQITASHNPPDDNGYKVYWGDGAQIAPPLDEEITAAMGLARPPGLAPPAHDAPAPDAVLTTELREAYRRDVVALVEDHPDAAPDRDRPAREQLRVVVTPLHGVAGDDLVAVLGAAGFGDVRLVASQAAPDPDFPTVSFPNPEEPGALDAGLAEAAACEADLLLATDPDGDRVAVAVPPRDGDRGDVAAWRLLSGDELGCLLADDRLAHDSGPDRVVATTVVSSRLLARIAAYHGVAHAETLTGFKWLARVVSDHVARGRRHVLSYEQALGVMTADVVRDKDGISACLLLADLAARRRAAGSDVEEALGGLARRHGLHATAGRSVRLDPSAGTDVVGEALGRVTGAPPRELAGTPVAALVDHRAGTRRDLTSGEESPLDTPRTDLVGLELVDGGRCQVRPSGTEPLLKCYIEVVEPVGDDEEVVAARGRASARLGELTDAFLAALGLA